MLTTRLGSRPAVVLSICLANPVASSPGSAVSAAESADPLVAALRLAVARRVDVVRKWLDERDFKSLTQSAGGLRTLTALLQARSDDESSCSHDVPGGDWLVVPPAGPRGSREPASRPRAHDLRLPRLTTGEEW